MRASMLTMNRERENALGTPVSGRVPPHRQANQSGLLRHPTWDSLFIGLALIHGLFLLVAPSPWLIGFGLWWNANTIAHNFIHAPFFRSRGANAIFSGYLSLLLGFPQRLWRDRHLAHHAETRYRWRWSVGLGIEIGLVLLLWTT